MTQRLIRMTLPILVHKASLSFTRFSQTSLDIPIQKSISSIVLGYRAMDLMTLLISIPTHLSAIRRNHAHLLLSFDVIVTVELRP